MTELEALRLPTPHRSALGCRPTMTELTRFGIAMEKSLLAELDELAELRGANRSEIIRDLVRAEVARMKTQEGVPAVGTLIFVYDHHVRDLTERLTMLQHDMGERVLCNLHVHLDHHHCLEIVVLRGDSQELRVEGDRLLATRGVVHGALHVVPENLEGHGHHDRHHHEDDPKKPKARAKGKSKE